MTPEGSSRIANWLSSMSAFMKCEVRRVRRERMRSFEACRYTQVIGTPVARDWRYSRFSAEQATTRSSPRLIESRMRE